MQYSTSTMRIPTLMPSQTQGMRTPVVASGLQFRQLLYIKQTHSQRKAIQKVHVTSQVGLHVFPQFSKQPGTHLTSQDSFARGSKLDWQDKDELHALHGEDAIGCHAFRVVVRGKKSNN